MNFPRNPHIGEGVMPVNELPSAGDLFVFSECGGDFKEFVLGDPVMVPFDFDFGSGDVTVIARIVSIDGDSMTIEVVP